MSPEHSNLGTRNVPGKPRMEPYVYYTMHDTPGGIASGREKIYSNLRQEFESCMVCLGGYAFGKTFGCLYWSAEYDWKIARGEYAEISIEKQPARRSPLGRNPAHPVFWKPRPWGHRCYSGQFYDLINPQVVIEGQLRSGGLRCEQIDPGPIV